MRHFIITAVLTLVFATSSLAGTLHLSVAASMTNAVNAMICQYQQDHPETTVLPNFASSGALAKQITQGAPADIYISANPKWMNYLVENDMIAAAQVRTLAFNTLVVAGNPTLQLSTMNNLLTLKTLAIGSPKSVPAGQYAQQALEGAGLYQQLESHLVLAKDVRQALLYADRGEVDGAFVYKTDALLAKQAKIILEVPQELYNEVTYPVALTLVGEKNPEAVDFAKFLASPAAGAILEQFGFVVR